MWPRPSGQTCCVMMDAVAAKVDGGFGGSSGIGCCASDSFCNSDIVESTNGVRGDAVSGDMCKRCR